MLLVRLIQNLSRGEKVQYNINIKHGEIRQKATQKSLDHSQGSANSPRANTKPVAYMVEFAMQSHLNRTQLLRDGNRIQAIQFSSTEAWLMALIEQNEACLT